MHRSLESVLGNSQDQLSQNHLLEQLINNFKGREGTNLILAKVPNSLLHAQSIHAPCISNMLY